MNKKQLRASFLLLVCAFVWGSTFVAQSSAAKRVSPFIFLATRSFVGGIALLIFSILIALYKHRSGVPTLPASKKSSKKLALAGILCGTALAVASACQQYGMTLGTGAGKAGFLTALYLVFVPLLNYLFFHQSPGTKVILGSIFALIGLFLLCGINVESSLSIGDIVTSCCGLCFAVHILIIDRLANDLDGIKLSCIQFFVCGVISLTISLIFEPLSVATLSDATGSILYAGLVSSALGYTLQIIGQKDCPPAVATVLMSLESVFALLSDSVIALANGNPVPITGIEFLGCLIMFVGVLLAQNPSRSTTK